MPAYTSDSYSMRLRKIARLIEDEVDRRDGKVPSADDLWSAVLRDQPDCELTEFQTALSKVSSREEELNPKQSCTQRMCSSHIRNSPKADDRPATLCANSRSSSGLVMTRLSRTNSDFGTCLTSTQCDLMCAGTLHGPAKSVQNSDVSVLLSSRLFARLNREVHRNNRDHCQDDHVDRNRPGLRLELRHQPGGDQRRQGAREN